MPHSTGTRVGPYEILAPIESGGMGEVYKAQDTRLDRSVAIKISAEQFSELSLSEISCALPTTGAMRFETSARS